MKYNQDIFVDESIAQNYPSIFHFVKCRPLEERFKSEEKTAIFNKQLFQWGSMCSLLMIGSGVIASSYYVLIGAPATALPTIKWLSLLVILGSVMQIVLWRTNAKEKWIIARYAAARIRSIKAQLIAQSAFLSNNQLTEEYANKYVKIQLEKLNKDLETQLGVLKIFSADRIVQLSKKSNEAYPQLEESKAAYDFFRIVYQSNFAIHEAKNLQDNVENFKGVGLTVFFCLAIAGAVVSSLSVFDPSIGFGYSQSQLLFVSISLFVVSAVMGLASRISLREPNRDRYDKYIKDLEMIKFMMAEDGASFFDKVMEMESLAADELKAFCDDAKNLSGRL